MPATTIGYVIADLILARSSICFSSVDGQPDHHLVEHAPDLAGAHHGQVDRREDLRVAGHRL